MSHDIIIKAEKVVNYPTVFLNLLHLPALTRHTLKLKIGVPIILSRNINQPKLCCDTRIAVKKLMMDVEAKYEGEGDDEGEDVFISGIPMILLQIQTTLHLKNCNFQFDWNFQ